MVRDRKGGPGTISCTTKVKGALLSLQAEGFRVSQGFTPVMLTHARCCRLGCHSVQCQQMQCRGTHLMAGRG